MIVSGFVVGMAGLVVTVLSPVLGVIVSLLALCWHDTTVDWENFAVKVIPRLRPTAKI